MQKWEYKVTEWRREIGAGINPKAKDWESNFNFQKLGEEGWELVSAIPNSNRMGPLSGVDLNIIFVFKRPVES